MSEYKFIETLPSPAEYNRLRAAVGWSVYDESVIQSAIPHSLYCICAFTCEEMIGMARVIGDTGMVFYVQDVIVLPAYQGQGIGSQMMEAVMGYIRNNAHNHTIVGLMAAKNKESFYKKYGFFVRPTDNFGAGMTLFWSETHGGN